jgi:hypothetical protein
MAEGNKGKKGRRPADGKRKRPTRPPLEDFGDSEYSEEVSFEYDRSPAPVSPMASSDDSDDSMGLFVAERAYIRSVECGGLDGLDDSEEVSSEEAKDSSDSKEGSDAEGDDSSDGSGKGCGGDGNIGGNVPPT